MVRLKKNFGWNNSAPRQFSWQRECNVIEYACYFQGNEVRGSFQRIKQKAFGCYSILHGSKNLHCVTKSMEIIFPVRVSFARTCILYVSILTSDSVGKAWSEWLSQRKVMLNTVWKLPYTAFDCFPDQSLTSKTCWTQCRGLTSATLSTAHRTQATESCDYSRLL